MLKLFEAMMHDWAVIRQGGWTFAMIVAVAFGAGLGVAAWHYGERLETERVRLAGKDDLLAVAPRADGPNGLLDAFGLRAAAARLRVRGPAA